MKTAVSIPDDLFQKADRLAKRVGTSRSQLFSEALREYLARHDPEEITEALDRVVEEVGDERDPFMASAARRVLEQTDW